MNSITPYISRFLVETIDDLSDKALKKLSKLLQKNFPNVGDAFEFKIGTTRYEPFQFASKWLQDKTLGAKFYVGYGAHDNWNPQTNITQDQKEAVIDYIDEWAKPYDLHLSRTDWSTSSNVYTLSVGFSKLSSDSADLPAVIYHITSLENLESIKARGLIPSRPKQKEASQRFLHDPVGQRRYPPRVYFFLNKQMAHERAQKDSNNALVRRFEREVLNSEYGSTSSIAKNENVIILKIDSGFVREAFLDSDYEGNEAAFTNSLIPAGAILDTALITPTLKIHDMTSRFYKWRELVSKNGHQKMEEILADFASTIRRA